MSSQLFSCLQLKNTMYVYVCKRVRFLMQVPSVPDANTHAMKVIRRKKLVLELLQFAPVDATSGDSESKSASSLLCGRPANAPTSLDF